MHIDLGEDRPGRLEADVAIVGSGVAGLTLARRLIEGGRSVLLLESGGLDYEAATADLNRGFSVGEDYYPLEDSRLRFVGGTTAIWGGRVAEFDAIDFERREWVPHSGWPFGLEALAGYYRDARTLLDLPADAPDPLPSLLDQVDGPEVERREWLIDPQFDRFGHEAQRALFEHPRLTLVTHATVREIRCADDGGRIVGLDVVSPSGERVEVVAHDYVVAAGGLENPRLLLASNSVKPAGLGNDHDLVGRFFMEHPHGRGGHMVASGKRLWSLIEAFQKQSIGHYESASLVRPSDALQRERRVLNSALALAVRPAAGSRQPLLTSAYLAAKHRLDPTKRGRSAWRLYKSAGRVIRHNVGPLMWWLRHRRGNELALVLRAEQAPNPDSRVTLNRDELDATGMPRAVLDWRMTPLDRVSAAELVHAFGRRIEALDLGKVMPEPWLDDPARDWVSDPLVSVHPLGGYHHMGTTRMADDPRQGVTDGFGRVHGLPNLWVAGSSLFPTGGWANPTLTIIALALRQADRLLGRL
ncbi:GMC family oxidoreductase [Sphingomonas swuensis]|uniref:GMC family oxidoreductase n=2 Tax=Sphingomonas swuensis TaxID=977800 RepID=A0ABP7SBY7_9SPHN